ncbi:MAG: 3-deoxy-7-phosphoheptulonate synthase [Ruminococcus sp.]|jgi:3-deoxy-7-phosphoheptulonate synthase|nr:3-deoxy-7-phosphoheptulonate synthase [Ruminococcus sp.]
MIIILKNSATKDEIAKLEDGLKAAGLNTNLIVGAQQSIIGLIGDTSRIDLDGLYAQECVESVTRIQEPFKKSNRKMHPANTLITVGNCVIGDGSLNVIAGPCSVESEEQLFETARAVKSAGATMLRGGAFKPRTSPYAFQGLEKEGLRLLSAAKKETGLPIVTEIMAAADLDLFEDVDIIQVGARNMQNFDLLKVLGTINKPILLKRGLSATIEELLMSAEYIMSGGNNEVIFCERGIRTFETMTRNTMDVSAIPLLKQKSHLPVCVDPSHAAGIISLIEPLSLAAVVTGADALEIEVHCNPKKALSDGGQQLRPDNFEKVMEKIKTMCGFLNKDFGRQI